MLQYSIMTSNVGDIARPLSARSIALSVLLGSHPPELPVRALVALAEMFEVAPGTMRTALSRMVANGDVTLDDGRYRLGEALLDRQRSQAFDRLGDIEWNGDWHMVIAVDDQRELSDRRSFRGMMANHRFGELRPDIWMRPANQPPPPAARGRLTTTGRIDGPAGVDIARRLWELPVIDDTARRLIDDLDRLDRVVDWDQTAAIPIVFPVAATVVRFLRAEPNLPVELLPKSWPIPTLRRRYECVDAKHRLILGRFLGAA